MFNVVYIVKATEYERGYGSRPDGYLVFATEEQAAAFVDAREQEESRNAFDAPDYYVNYDMVGYEKCSDYIFNNVIGNGRGWYYINRLSELMNW
jgi:hypothetical protein